MTRLALVVTSLGALVTAGCDKKDEHAAGAPSAPEKSSTDDRDKPPAEEREQVTRTGVLDLELAAKGGRYTVRNATFELTFPVRPQVQAQQDRAADNTVLHSALAIATRGSDELGFFVMPIPRAVTYDVDKGMNGARDGAMTNIGATILGETDAKLGGLAARKVAASATHGGRKLYVDLYLAWDEPHRQMIGVFTGAPNAQASSTALAFVGSLKVKPAVAAPTPAPTADPKAPETSTQTGILGLVLAERNGVFTLRDAAYRVTFPARPAIEKADNVAPDGTKLAGAVATASIGNDQGYGLILMRIPEAVRYDPNKGLKAARDGMIRQLGAKLVDETATTIAGIPGRRSRATVTIEHHRLSLELQFAYDKDRHAVFGLYSATPAGAPSAAALAFFSSFEIAKR